MAPLLANYIRAVPYINPKHKGEWHIKLEKDHIEVKTDRLRVKKSIRGQNNSDLDWSWSFKPKYIESDSRSNLRELEMEPGFRQELKNWGRLDQMIYITSPVESLDL